MFGDGLHMVLTSHPDIRALPVVRDAEAALKIAVQERPQVVLMDIDLPGMDGIEATRRLATMCPESAVVIITALMNPDLITKAVQAGAAGFVSKQRAADELIDTIRRTAEGESMFLPHELHALFGGAHDRSGFPSRPCPLTKRELEVLQALVDGKTTDEVADALFLSKRTVQGHVQSVLTKLGVRSKLEAVLDGLRRGYVGL
jgi:DNA-binding NarL/FixJ family response regulator